MASLQVVCECGLVSKNNGAGEEIPSNGLSVNWLSLEFLNSLLSLFQILLGRSSLFGLFVCLSPFCCLFGFPPSLGVLPGSPCAPCEVSLLPTSSSSKHGGVFFPCAAGGRVHDDLVSHVPTQPPLVYILFVVMIVWFFVHRNPRRI